MRIYEDSLHYLTLIFNSQRLYTSSLCDRYYLPGLPLVFRELIRFLDMYCVFQGLRSVLPFIIPRI